MKWLVLAGLAAVGVGAVLKNPPLKNWLLGRETMVSKSFVPHGSAVLDEGGRQVYDSHGDPVYTYA